MKSPGLGLTGGAFSFLPNQLAGCVGWYRADVSPAVSGGVVTTLADLSGNGNMFTFPSGHRPAYSSNGGPLSRPCVTFDGSTSYGTTAASITTNVQNWTQFLVTKVPNTTQGNAFMFSTGLTNGWGFDIAPTGLRGVLWTGTGSGSFGSNTTSWEAWTSWDSAGTNNTAHVNGSAIATSATISPASVSGGSVLGCYGAGVSAFAAFSLWELIVFSRALSATEITEVEQYIRRQTAIW